MSIGFDSLDESYFTVSKITTHKYDRNCNVTDDIWKTGTGFFYENEGNTFLITNRHNVVKEQENYFPNVLRLYLHADEKDLTTNTTFDIHLYNGGMKRIWIEPKDKRADVVAIPMKSDDWSKKRRGEFFPPMIYYRETKSCL